jgi:hypothetical protein
MNAVISSVFDVLFRDVLGVAIVAILIVLLVRQSRQAGVLEQLSEGLENLHNELIGANDGEAGPTWNAAEPMVLTLGPITTSFKSGSPANALSAIIVIFSGITNVPFASACPMQETRIVPSTV